VGIETGQVSLVLAMEYSVFLNEDESEAVVIERFVSSEALLEHGANMAETRRRSCRQGPSRASSWVTRTTSCARG